MDEWKFHCRFLGVKLDANLEDIKKAYRESAKILHPDRHQDSPFAKEKFQQLVESYHYLVDPKNFQSIHLSKSEAAHSRKVHPGNVPGSPQEEIQKFLIKYTTIARKKPEDLANLEEMQEIISRFLNASTMIEIVNIFANYCVERTFNEMRLERGFLWTFAIRTIGNSQIKKLFNEETLKLSSSIFGNTDERPLCEQALNEISVQQKVALLFLARDFRPACRDVVSGYLEALHLNSKEGDLNIFFIDVYEHFVFRKNQKAA